ncbi:SAM-dependent methyltransferase [Chelatococcus composti]|jgi:Cyclopropane fatty acid synthase and related methyltransferases|uniref:Cyclopropane-fatty-acyl-phospholipid synthase n=1 Tax=Chelatococcus composti TaxID=1743235 RepID=A0A841KB26_9HYPH|nr:cyclopropane-fatty-acyl-phospholipid synthase family protein [Chelatococcus composti]MBB6169651.1 cyclopropane-fatty-acyl-phospholipid synthase [Chelatococcus composti]MBS7736822.1 class I SAM-dependent methyltransferase [Chelatococcus composti]PZN44668.1 MAG: SAM-dependent methyltransferase [Pseudomonadota bacterium]GGG49371.1 replicative DNA helicase [Chelatococcus composti]
MDRLLRPMLRRLIRQGSLEVQVADEPPFVVGDGSGPPLSVRIADRRAVLALLLNPDLALGELYMDGRLSMQKGDIADLIALGMINLRLSTPPLPVRLVRRWRKWLRAVMQWNRMPQARRNVAHHYDLDGRLYSLFLDADRQYSCAYFETPDQCLDDAQLAKKRHITAKLLVEPGHKVLDIGCGWGGLGLYLGAYAEAEVLGITLSQEQLGVANARAKERNLADKVQFRLQDYRAVEGRFDRIVSVGMFEHVGVPYYQTFFDTVARLLDDDGVMLLHSIGRMEEPGATNSWIAKYIFPGGYIPALSEVLPAIERAGLIVTDIEILRLHYAETLKAWRQRFHARREEAVALYDERFARMWDFYLAGSEMSFRHDGMMVFQIQLAKKVDTVPLTRNYIAEREAALRRREGQRSPLRLAGE